MVDLLYSIVEHHEQANLYLFMECKLVQDSELIVQSISNSKTTVCRVMDRKMPALPELEYLDYSSLLKENSIYLRYYLTYF